MDSIRILDSHTGGEPTRLVLEGGPDLGEGPLELRLRRFRESFDAFRSAIVNEPRGSDTVVGALLCKPHREECDIGVIFFNNVGYLGMCGHGTIGVIVSLAHLGMLKPGTVKIDTPVGVVEAQLLPDGSVAVANVPSYRKAHAVTVDVSGVGPVTGDVAWGGNWFFLVEQERIPIRLTNVESLTDLSWRIRQAVNAQGYPEIDHVELLGATPTARSRNFVLCPGKAYDRSPCGTGTSAKLACLAADGKLAEGEEWTQESVLGSVFKARYRWLDRAKGTIAPTIMGTAHVTADAKLLLDPNDPFCWGIRDDKNMDAMRG
ncbi:proline racemase family protein [Peristeroidobacter agariperforans]|uniref:proline racemase family protein n=1 Tax=Peristeroidobacter agariperforans TaxID=268404 RepID=UPI00101C9578|nr:proline racemase family protein [Peristeroidobacter agariperforans]